jgi:hypothetical protein
VLCEIHQTLEWNKGHGDRRFSSIVTGGKERRDITIIKNKDRKDMSGCDGDTPGCQSMKKANQKAMLRNTLYRFYDTVLQSTGIAY